MKIITGATGEAHVTSNDDGEFNQGIWGEGLVILANGSQLSATIIDNNTIRIADGDIVFQGRHGLIEPNTYEDVSIATGASGQNRKDLICVQYKLENGVESMSLVVKKGTATSGTATDPSYTEGTIRTGSLLAEIPLYRVNISGISIASIDTLATASPYLIDVGKKKIEYGTALPSASNYNDGDIFLLYE